MIDLTESTNGTYRHRVQPAKRGKAGGGKKGAPPRSRRGTGARRRAALVLASVAAGLVFLSVYHLTCAVSTLTGSPSVLALLLAVGIDLGLVASEAAGA